VYFLLSIKGIKLVVGLANVRCLPCLVMLGLRVRLPIPYLIRLLLFVMSTILFLLPVNFSEFD
jgi:hypothetical protein